jgi:hypothetical protein
MTAKTFFNRCPQEVPTAGIHNGKVGQFCWN